jgi:hypothetical protein
MDYTKPKLTMLSSNALTLAAKRNSDTEGENNMGDLRPMRGPS